MHLQALMHVESHTDQERKQLSICYHVLIAQFFRKGILFQG